MTHLVLHYQEYGNKSAPTMMVFLHGAGVSGWMWDKQVDYFTDYHCVVPDLPEHGLSQNGMTFSGHSKFIWCDEEGCLL